MKKIMRVISPCGTFDSQKSATIQKIAYVGLHVQCLLKLGVLDLQTMLTFSWLATGGTMNFYKI